MTITPRRPTKACIHAALTSIDHRVSLLCDPDGTILWASPSTARVIGWVPETLVGTAVAELHAPEQFGAMVPTVRVECGDGSVLTVDSHPTVVALDDGDDGLLIEWSPVAQLGAAAEIDHFTGLLNRAGFDRVVRELTEVGNVPVAAVHLDIDEIEPSDDQHGRPIRDEVLRHVGHRVRSALREHDVACRVGEDEFVVICRGRWGAKEARALAERLRAEVGGPVLVGEVALMVGVSAGVAAGPALLLPSLLEQADADRSHNKRSRTTALA
jgi:diguanylate cyclase (GGDEF)-like protein